MSAAPRSAQQRPIYSYRPDDRREVVAKLVGTYGRHRSRTAPVADVVVDYNRSRDSQYSARYLGRALGVAGSTNGTSAEVLVLELLPSGELVTISLATVESITLVEIDGRTGERK